MYVSVLKISIVHADSASKSLRQNFLFSRERPLLARGKILYFATIMDTNWESAHQAQNEDNSPTFALGLEFLNEAVKEKTRHQRRHDSLHCARVKCDKFWQIDTLVKPNKWQTGLFNLQSRLKFFRFKIVKTRTFNRKSEIKPVPILLNVSLNANNPFFDFNLNFTLSSTWIS